MEDTLAKYEKIAHDITEKIISGEFPEGSILKGRSLLASLYGVSPETIRKAVQLLSEEKILYVKHGVGVFVDSQAKAKEYANTWNGAPTLTEDLENVKALIKEARELNEKICSSVEVMAENFRFQVREAIQFQEVTIDSHSWIVGKTIGEVNFWNYTEATIVAVRRAVDGLLQTSPGPDFPLDAGDKLIFVGKDEYSFERVEAFLTYGIEE